MTGLRQRATSALPLRRSSIRRRLALTLMASTGVLWAVVTAFGLYGVRHEAREISDAQLSQASLVLMTVLNHEIRENYPDPGLTLAQMVPRIFPEEKHPHIDPPAFIVRAADQRLILHSKDAEPLLQSLDRRSPTGLNTISIDDQAWRVLVSRDLDTQLWVAVAQPLSTQQALASELAVNFIVPLLLALPVLGILILITVKRGLNSLDRLTDKVARHSTSDLSPLSDAQVPAEALPLTRALDDLLQRLEQSHRREQRFIADATHELRTPLAGLKMQAQVALSAASDEQRSEALESLNLGVDHATRLIAQLLTLARLDHQADINSEATNSLLEVARELCTELSSRAQAAEIELKVNGDGPCPVKAERTLLSILVRNLIENAIQYGGRGKHISIDVRCCDQRPELTVTDQGPGIPEQDLERVFERFYRSAKQRTPGSGLGLSIVKGIAASCGAQVTLSNNPAGGLSVAVRFRRA